MAPETRDGVLHGSPRAAAPAGAAVGRGREASPPLPVSAQVLLARSDGELVAAQMSTDPHERFLHAHFAALRAGAALLEVTGRPRRRPAPRTVWDMVAAVAPELSGWSTYFAAGAALRSAVESGRVGGVDAGRADEAAMAAEEFQDAVRAVLGTAHEQPRLPLTPARAAS